MKEGLGVTMHFPFTFFVGFLMLGLLIAIVVGLIILAVKLTNKDVDQTSNQARGMNNEAYGNTYKSEETKVKYCMHCGQRVEPHQVVCLHCGAQIKSLKPQEQMSSRQLAGGLLGIFLGVWGIHNFYLGYTQKAIIQLLLGTVGIVLVVGPVISSIWGLIEGILILTGQINKDGFGEPI